MRKALKEIIKIIGRYQIPTEADKLIVKIAKSALQKRTGRR